LDIIQLIIIADLNLWRECLISKLFK